MSSFILLIGGTAFAAAKQQVKDMISKAIRDEVLAKHPSYKSAEINIFYKYADSTFNSLSGKHGKISFAISEMYPDFDPVGDVIIPFQVYEGSLEAEKIFLRTKVEIWLDVVVAAQKIAKRQVISEADIKLAKRDIGSLSKRYFVSPEAVAGNEILSSIAKDTVIQDWMVRIPPQVSKNDEVVISVKGENITATARGLALEDGYRGERVKVRNLDTNKEIRAVVVGSDEVSVELK